MQHILCVRAYLRTKMHRCALIQPFTRSFLVSFVHAAFRNSFICFYTLTYTHTYNPEKHTYTHTYIHTYIRTYIHTYMHAVWSGSVAWCGVLLGRQLHVHRMTEKTPCRSRRWGFRGCTSSMLGVEFITCRPGLKVSQPLQSTYFCADMTCVIQCCS